jgi:hypothetical protein
MAVYGTETVGFVRKKKRVGIIGLIYQKRDKLSHIWEAQNGDS